MFETMVLVMVLITSTLAVPECVTYTSFPSGLTAIPCGTSPPVLTLVTTVFVAVLTTVMLLVLLPARDNGLPSGLIAIPHGGWGVWLPIVATTELLTVLITAILPPFWRDT